MVVVVQQHESALARANDVRLSRARLRQEVKTNPCRVLEVVADPPDYCLTLEVMELLMWLPRWGHTRARRAIAELGRSENVRFQSLTPRGRSILLAQLGRVYL